MLAAVNVKLTDHFASCDRERSGILANVSVFLQCSSQLVFLCSGKAPRFAGPPAAPLPDVQRWKRQRRLCLAAANESQNISALKQKNPTGIGCCCDS